MYTYYQEISKPEHYPFAFEVANLLRRQFSIVSLTGKDHVRLAKACLEQTEKNSGRPEEKLYYPTRNGLLRVYPNWRKAVLLIQTHSSLQEDKTYQIKVDNKTYHYKKEEESPCTHC